MQGFIIMKKHILSLSLLTVSLHICAQDAKTAATKTAVSADSGIKLEAAQLKIGFVDPYRALEQSDEWKDQQQRVQNELNQDIRDYQKLEESFRAKQQELQNMGKAASETARKNKEKELNTLKTEIMVKRQMLEEGSNQIMQEVQMKILKKIEDTVGGIAREEGLDLVHGMGIVFASAKVDLTQQVVERMNAEYAKQKARNKPASQPAALKTAQNSKPAPQDTKKSTPA
jgi:outer membrane protein